MEAATESANVEDNSESIAELQLQLSTSNVTIQQLSAQLDEKDYYIASQSEKLAALQAELARRSAAAAGTGAGGTERQAVLLSADLYPLPRLEDAVDVLGFCDSLLEVAQLSNFCSHQEAGPATAGINTARQVLLLHISAFRAAQAPAASLRNQAAPAAPALSPPAAAAAAAGIAGGIAELHLSAQSPSPSTSTGAGSPTASFKDFLHSSPRTFSTPSPCASPGGAPSASPHALPSASPGGSRSSSPLRDLPLNAGFLGGSSLGGRSVGNTGKGGSLLGGGWPPLGTTSLQGGTFTGGSSLAARGLGAGRGAGVPGSSSLGSAAGLCQVPASHAQNPGAQLQFVQQPPPLLVAAAAARSAPGSFLIPAAAAAELGGSSLGGSSLGGSLGTGRGPGRLGSSSLGSAAVWPFQVADAFAPGHMQYAQQAPPLRVTAAAGSSAAGPPLIPAAELAASSAANLEPPPPLPANPKNPTFADCVARVPGTDQVYWGRIAIRHLRRAADLRQLLLISALYKKRLVNDDVPAYIQALRLIRAAGTYLHACTHGFERGRSTTFVLISGILPDELQSSQFGNAPILWLVGKNGGEGELMADLSGYNSLVTAALPGFSDIQLDCSERMLGMLKDIAAAAGGAKEIKRHTKALKAMSGTDYFLDYPALTECISRLKLMTASCTVVDTAPPLHMFSSVAM